MESCKWLSAHLRVGLHIYRVLSVFRVSFIAYIYITVSSESHCSVQAIPFSCISLQLYDLVVDLDLDEVTLRVITWVAGDLM